MKKVININFQGRVVPIEESAYDMLQQYTASLRSYFANEEGRDEIINDIESRIGELFAEQLKKGASCITDADVNAVINSMGRPSDFEQADDEGSGSRNQGAGYTEQGTAVETGAYSGQQNTYTKKRLYRDEEDKILGGVASGLANYLGIDPAVMRIIFAISAFAGGFGFLVYIVLWIALPGKSLVTSIRKRLYRDSDDKVFGGVCGGLAKYFDINVSIPRVIFAAPFIFGLITSIGRNFFMNGPVYIGGFSGGTFIITYIILWIVLPEAKTAHEKLEMKGEKIDLNSIRNTVMGDMKGFKDRAERMGRDISGSAREFGARVGEMGQELGNAGSNIMGDTASAVRRHRGGLGNAIAILVKAFVVFIGGCIAIALFVGLIALLGGGVGVLPLKDFFLDGPWQNLFAWGTLLLFVGIPVIAFITWLIRRLIKVKTHNRYIGYSFSALWFLGLVCLIGLIATMSRNFSTPNSLTEDFTLTQPANDVLFVSVSNSNMHSYNNWLDFDGAISLEGDSLYLNTVRVNVIRSNDSLYHVHTVKISNGRNNQNSRTLVEKISFPIAQRDSVLYLPESFGISRFDKWRNQRVLVVIEVPVGKKIKLDNMVDDYDYFNVEFGNRRNRRINLPRNWEDGEYWRNDRTLIMTNEELVPLYRKGKNNNRQYRYDEDEVNNENPEPLPSNPKSANVPLPKSSKDSIIKAFTDSINRKDTGYRYGNANDGADKTGEANISATASNYFSPLSSLLMMN